MRPTTQPFTGAILEKSSNPLRLWLSLQELPHQIKTEILELVNPQKQVIQENRTGPSCRETDGGEPSSVRAVCRSCTGKPEDTVGTLAGVWSGCVVV